MDKLKICKQTREITADALYNALKKLLESKKPISEAMLRDAWLFELRKHSELFPDGWYMPPPHGLGVLFGTKENVGRLYFKSLRREKNFPRKDVFLNKKNGLVFLYAGPINRDGIIGDMEMTLYFGRDKEIIDYLKLYYRLIKQIIDFIEIGLTFRAVFEYSEKLFAKHGFVNAIVSMTDPTSKNIGHTIPFIVDEMTLDEKDILRNEKWSELCKLVSNKRIFLNAKEEVKITPNMAFTIEPGVRMEDRIDMPFVAFHTTVLIHENGEKELLTNFDKIFKLVGMDYMITSVLKNQKITYYQVGDDYSTKDPIKKLFQESAAATGLNLKAHGFSEIVDTRGESGYVWQQGNVLMASVIEGLGTKNLVADGTRKFTKKTHYDVIAHDTVATIINDLVSVGATPLVLHAYWAIEDNDWLYDKERMTDLITGWKKACDIAGVSWGGGETTTMKQIVVKDTAEFGGSAVGIIKNKKNLVTDKKLKVGDRIILIKSNGVNANGISLTRAIAKKLPKGYGTIVSGKLTYGEALLTKSNIYANVIQDLQKANVDIHYISNITGHGIRKIMRGRPKFTYIIEKIFKPQPVFDFIKEHAGLDDYEMYQTYNMGQDYAIFVAQKDVEKTLRIIKKNKFVGLNAGYVEKGEKQVIIKPKNLVFKGETLDLR